MATDDRIGYLAAGFALGELDDSELRELYEALREPGDAGRAAARTTWQVLGSTVDLRAATGTQLQDTVALRLMEEGRPGDDTVELGPGARASRDFMGQFRGRMGMSRPRLGEVSAPGPVERKLRMQAPLALAVVIALAAAAFALARGGTESVARVTSVKGEATVEGEPVFAGGALDRRPLILAAGASIGLEWREGHAVGVSGPANLVPQGEGLSLSSGAAWARLGPAAFTLGLPDQQVVCEPGSEVAVEVADNRSAVGVARGSAGIVVGGGAERAERARLAEGEAAVLASGAEVVRFRWQLSAALERKGPALYLAGDPEARAWRFGTTVSWKGVGDAVAFAGSGSGWVRLLPGAVIMRGPEGGESVHTLSGAPLLERRVEMVAPPGGEATLVVEGLRRALPLPFARPVREIRLTGGAGLARPEFHTGPPPAPSVRPGAEPGVPAAPAEADAD